MTYKEVIDTIESLPYKITKSDGQYIVAESVHKWDTENNKPLSANGKRIIEANVEPTGDKSYSGLCFFGIREDGNTRTAFDGIVETPEQIIMLERLTNSFLWRQRTT
jgi:hypothetical protein